MVTSRNLLHFSRHHDFSLIVVIVKILSDFGGLAGKVLVNKHRLFAVCLSS